MKKAVVDENSIPKLLSVVPKVGVSPKRRGTINFTKILRKK